MSIFERLRWWWSIPSSCVLLSADEQTGYVTVDSRVLTDPCGDPEDPSPLEFRHFSADDEVASIVWKNGMCCSIRFNMVVVHPAKKK